jgi:hypothetical protein
LFPVHIAMVCVGWANQGQSYSQFLTAVNRSEHGGLAQTYFFGDMRDRDNGRQCKPLLFLLLLQNGTAVNTFANPTQQPIGISGPLSDALEMSGRTLARDAQVGRAAILENLHDAGFRTIVTCDDPERRPAADSPDLVAQNDVWSLYQVQKQAQGTTGSD